MHDIKTGSTIRRRIKQVPHQVFWLHSNPQHIVSYPAAGTGVDLDFENFKNHEYFKTNLSTTKNIHINHSKKQKQLSNQVSSGNDARLSPALMTNDMLIDGDYPCYETSGSDYGDSSLSVISNSLLETDFFQSNDFLNDISVDMLLILESL